MTKNEFEKRIGREVSASEYEEIEYVYAWHPAIKNVEGKDQIAAIFNAGGMMVIRSMKETAALAETVEKELRAEMRKVEMLKDRLQRLKEGNISYERCIKETEKAFDMAETKEKLEKLMNDLAEEYGYDIVEEAKKIVGI